MASEKYTLAANAVYRTICELLDGMEWQYEKVEKTREIYCRAKGDDLSVDVRIIVDADRQVVSVFSRLPFTVPEGRRDALAVAVSAANNGMTDGDFDYDAEKGMIVFRLTTSFFGSVMGRPAFEYMLVCACITVDHYNDKFLAVSENNMTFEEILAFID